MEPLEENMEDESIGKSRDWYIELKFSMGMQQGTFGFGLTFQVLV